MEDWMTADWIWEKSKCFISFCCCYYDGNWCIVLGENLGNVTKVCAAMLCMRWWKWEGVWRTSWHDDEMPWLVARLGCDLSAPSAQSPTAHFSTAPWPNEEAHAAHSWDAKTRCFDSDGETKRGLLIHSFLLFTSFRFPSIAVMCSRFGTAQYS